MKPRCTWLIAAFCFALLCGAMAWITHSMLGMEKNQNQMANVAAVQEKARLALWRMESIASALVIEESARPPEHYRTFSAPGTVLDNKTYASLDQANLITPSPLLQQPPDRVLLHFEMEKDGTLRSPQAPEGNDLATCRIVGCAEGTDVASNTKRLNVLRELMQKKVPDSQLLKLRESLHAPKAPASNGDWVWGNNFQVPASVSVPIEETKTQDRDQRQLKEQSPVQAPALQTSNLAQQSLTWQVDAAKQQQMELNSREAQARANIFEAGKGKVNRRASLPENYDDKPVEKARDPVVTKSETINKAAAPSASPAPPAAVKKAAQPMNPARVDIVSDFRAFWMGDALLLTRRVASSEREWIQGAWLDWTKLRLEMWDAVKDDFPAGRIAAAAASPSAGDHMLASLPVQLIPGAVSFLSMAFWSPLKASLALAWICVLLAIAAVALVLRGMMALSERRASFVSSVTHELRTPLATFKLYSEMLADGMVKEEGKRQNYLETLTTEADRLGHLVENVLSYSRIERGKGPNALTSVTVSDLVRRIEPRLNQRALMAGMDFAVNVPPEIMPHAIRTDSGAVEQILFNLVDNACKYGHRDGTPGSVELCISKDRRHVSFAIRDYGPGIARSEEKELFLPFHKSALAAAHSKPGVGLGLALCRKLAHELRGTLEIDRTWRHGACFVLKLPA